VRICHSRRAHLVQDHANAAPGNLPGCFGTGQAAANDVNGFGVCRFGWGGDAGWDAHGEHVEWSAVEGNHRRKNARGRRASAAGR